MTTAAHQALSNGWAVHKTRKMCGLPVEAPVPKSFVKAVRAEARRQGIPLERTLAGRRELALVTALAWDAEHSTPEAPRLAAASAINELLTEARKYLRTASGQIAAPPWDYLTGRDVRGWINHTCSAMQNKITPLCTAAGLTFDHSRCLEVSYECLKTEFKLAGDRTLKPQHPLDRGLEFQAVMEDFEQGVEAWCQEYERAMAG